MSATGDDKKVAPDTVIVYLRARDFHMTDQGVVLMHGGSVPTSAELTWDVDGVYFVAVSADDVYEYLLKLARYELAADMYWPAAPPSLKSARPRHRRAAAD